MGPSCIMSGALASGQMQREIPCTTSLTQVQGKGRPLHQRHRHLLGQPSQKRRAP